MAMVTAMAMVMAMATVTVMVKKDKDSVWYVLYTKAKNEKKVFEILTLKGYDCYCPTHKVLKQWSDRNKWVEEVLFKSYIFVKLPEFEQSKIDVLQTSGVVRFLFWLGKVAQVKCEEILAIKRFLGEHHSNVKVDFISGSNVEINHGVLKGINGVVDYQTEKDVVLKIEKLGMSLVARVPKQHISPS